jgi:fluoride exporter
VVADPAGRPLHRQPRLVLLVALGGALGTALRAAVPAAVPAALPASTGDWPWATWTVNLSGAFLLGLLLERLARTGPDDGRRRDVRLLAGTGFLGGFTTYSTLALETVTLATAEPVRAVLYAGSTVLLGLAAAAVGMLAGARLRHTGTVGRPADAARPRRVP